MGERGGEQGGRERDTEGDAEICLQENAKLLSICRDQERELQHLRSSPHVRSREKGDCRDERGREGKGRGRWFGGRRRQSRKRGKRHRGVVLADRSLIVPSGILPTQELQRLLLRPAGHEGW